MRETAWNPTLFAKCAKRMGHPAPFLRALVALSASKSTRSLGADAVISSAGHTLNSATMRAQSPIPAFDVAPMHVIAASDRMNTADFET